MSRRAFKLIGSASGALATRALRRQHSTSAAAELPALVRFLDPAGHERVGRRVSATQALCFPDTPTDDAQSTVSIGGLVFPRSASHNGLTQSTAIEQLLPPLQPTAILCIGLNYRRHVLGI